MARAGATCFAVVGPRAELGALAGPAAASAFKFRGPSHPSGTITSNFSYPSGTITSNFSCSRCEAGPLKPAGQHDAALGGNLNLDGGGAATAVP
jgi:hypothetical protein